MTESTIIKTISSKMQWSIVFGCIGKNLIFRIQNDDILIFEHFYFTNRKENQLSRVKMFSSK